MSGVFRKIKLFFLGIAGSLIFFLVALYIFTQIAISTGYTSLKGSEKQEFKPANLNEFSIETSSGNQ